MDLAEAMSRSNNSARLAGSDMNKFIGYVTTVADVTQKSADSVGESFKTIYSRFGNVKAGKFVADADELTSDSYDEAEYENLNDIETVLGAVGIKLRENATTYREIDEVLAEIGTKWKSFNGVTQNALSTAIAGTRQRENVAALFDNWPQVEKFSKIAENSYGTATKKMEAYNDSLEASQNRVTTAIEKITIDIKGSGVLITVNNWLAKIIDNIGVLTASLVALLAISNRGKLSELLVSGGSSLANSAMNIGNFFNGFTNKSEGGGWQSVVNSLDKTYEFQQQGNANTSLLKLAGKRGIEGAALTNMSNFQYELLGQDNKSQDLLVNFLKSSYETEDQLNGAKTNLAEIFKEQAKQVTSNLDVDGNLKEAKIKEIEARLDYAAKLKKENPETAELIADNSQEIRNSKKGSVVALQGVASIIGMVGGSVAGGQIGGKLGDTTGIIGSILGGISGQKVGFDIASAVGAAKKAGGLMSKAGVSAFASGISGFGWAGLALSVVGIFWKVYDNIQQKKLEEQKKKFEESVSKYKAAYSVSADVPRYSELVAGVDSLGNNVSLTNDDYQEFLDISNSLADAFPSLITRVDDAGNSFVGMNGKVSDVTDSVNILTKSLQHQADVALIAGDLLKDNYKTAHKDYSEAKSKKNSVNEALSILSEFKGQGELKEDINIADKNYSTEALNILKQVLGKENFSGSQYAIHFEAGVDIDEAIGNLTQLAGTYEQEMSSANQTLSDEVFAIIRESEGVFTDDTTDKQKQFITMAAQSIVPDGEKAEDWKDQIENTAQQTKDFINDNPELLDNLYNLDSLDEQQYEKIRAQEFEKLSKYLEDNPYKINILNGLNFEVDEDGSLKKDNQNNWEKVRDLLKGQIGEDLDSILQSTDSEDAGRIYKLLNTNKIFGNSSKEDVLLALSNDRLSSADSVSKKQIYATRSASTGKKILEDSNFQNTFKLIAGKGTNKNVDDINKDITNSYGSIPEEIRNAYQSIVEEYRNGNIELEEAQHQLAILFENNTNTQLNDILGQQAQEAFQGVKIDGIIDTWKELGDTFQYVADSMDLLSQAQNEEANNGKASLKTILSLLEANDSYVELLDLSTGKIKLKKNAEKLATDIQLKTIAANAEQTATTYDLRVAELEEEASSIKATLQAREQGKAMVSSSDDANNYAKEIANVVKYLAVAVTLFTGGDWKSVLGSDLFVIKDNTYTSTDYSTMTTEELEARYAEITGVDYKTGEATGNFGKLEIAEDNAEFHRQLSEDIYSGKITADSLQEDFGSNSSLNSDTALDIANAKDALVDKENEAMRAYRKNSNSGDTQYYSLKRASLQNKIEKLKGSMGTDKTEAERLGHLKDIQDAKKEIKNLDDEELADKESWAETLGNSLDRMKQIYEAQLKAADTYEEVIQAQKKLNDLLSEEYEDRVRIANSVIDTAKRNQSYFAPDTKEYSNYTRIISAQYKQIAKEAKAELQRQLDRLIEVRMGEVNSKTGKKYNRAEATEWAKMQTEYLDAENAYYEANQNVVQTALDTTEAKVQKIQNAIDKLENAKPQEWTSVNDIANYTNQLISGLTNQIALYKETLASSLDLTDEQIEDLNKKINDNLKAIQNAKIQQQQDIVNLNQKVYEAFTWQVNKYIDALNKYKEVIDKAYDDEIQKLRDINDSKERTIKLTELLQNLENANKEGKRVFRAGIGWVYEQDRSGIKKAQQELNSFYEEDRISDLQNTKDSEDKILDERVKNWQDYLSSIDDAYNKYDDDTKESLVKQKLNANSQEEVFNTLYDDMTQNTIRTNNGLDTYSGVLTGFCDDVYVQLQRLGEYQQAWVELLKQFNLNLPTTYTEKISADSGLSEDELATIQSYREQAKAGTITWGQANSYANEIRSSYGYTVDKSGNVSTVATNTVGSGSSNYTEKISADSGLSSSQLATIQSYRDKAKAGTITWDQANSQANEIRSSSGGYTVDKSGNVTKSYSTGVENGAVTYTGLAMLHGTPQSPEWVLNNSQMYNFVRNMSTLKTPSFSRNVGEAQGSNYNFYGDIDLPNVKDPSNFFSELMNATDNRISVTKNKL